ncbi:GGDEF domain-containing protein [Methylophilus sp. Leaf408]|uniref:GGDEF domain-containing protein n=1 Tax=Methylophilus sp. Leaf408 TaxID=2876561 RepID=UPI001E5198B9|nr:GGDEF domain-containing protein [Methylophilus sp. Leaf408]
MMPPASTAPALLGTTCINQQGVLVASIPLQGGKFVCQSVLKIAQANQYVIDFKNTSTIARFQHEIFEENIAENKVIEKPAMLAMMKGGLSSSERNPFVLRHGRIVSLNPGTYRLITWLQSPYYLAPPVLMLSDLASYQQQTNISAAISLLLLGILLGLFTYYATIGMLAGRITERLYASFLFGHLVFHAAALGIFNQFFEWHWFYLTGLPLLIANLAYVNFVCHLLGINPFHRPRLYRLSLIISGLLIALIILGMIFPHWMLDMARVGILLLLGFGLACGLRLSLQRQIIAQLYLLATISFGLLAMMAANNTQPTFTIEQLGLFAVTVHAILVSLLVAYKITRLHQEKELMLVELQNTRSLALTDRLTGIPNRHALENKLLQMPQHSCLMFLDMDNLKQLNDHFGHETGDHLLTLFTKILSSKLSEHGKLYRLGGDEFAILCHEDDVEWCQHQLEYTHLQLHKEGFGGAGASMGVVFAHEANSTEALLRIADKRMYENKRSRKNRKEMLHVMRP